MEATALCIRLVVNVLLLLVAQIQRNRSQDRPSVQIVPTRLQVFEYTSLSVDCEGSKATSGWVVMRSRMGEVQPEVSACVTNWVSATTRSACTIKPVYLSDSGLYWCETEGERSVTVNITVTAGAVILESPVLPVEEGDAATLRCTSKTTSSGHMADFFKDGLHVGNASMGEMTIVKVSKSHEGLYKCSISGLGESPESWMSVRAPHRETPHSADSSCHIYLVLRTVFTIVMVALLLLLVVLLHRGKLKAVKK